MNNLALFVCGLAVTLLSAMGVLVYMVSLGYESEKKKSKEPEPSTDATVEKSIMDSFVEIPSVS